jgi:hypothetical protein
VADAELIAKNVPAATAKASLVSFTNGDVPAAAMRASMLVEYAGFY